MNTHQSPSTRCAFTLIELLVVISIIALLAALLVSGGRTAMINARNLQCANVVQGINTGIRNYATEYNRLPLASGTGDEVMSLSAGNPLLGALLGMDGGKLNPKRISFIEALPAKNGSNGLVGDEGTYALLDLWGQPYQVILDANEDGWIANPDVENADTAISGKASRRLLTKVAVFSNGRDMKPHTKDDVVSWR